MCNLSSPIRGDTVYKDCVAGDLKLGKHFPSVSCRWASSLQISRERQTDRGVRRISFFVSLYLRMMGVTKVILPKCMLPSLLEGGRSLLLYLFKASS